VSLRLPGLLAVLCVAAAPPPPAAPPGTAGYWLDGEPADAAETALRTVLLSARGSPLDTAQALSAMSDAHPRTTASGLARIAGGLLLLDAGRAAEAEPFLTHPDVTRTQLKDHVAYGLGRVHEKTGDYNRSAASYRALLEASPMGLRCTALVRGADLQALVGRHEEALGLLNQALTSCPGSEPQALLQLGQAEQKRGDLRAAALAFDRLDRDYPASVQAKAAIPRLRTLARYLPPMTPQERLGRDLKKVLVLFQADRHTEAVRLFRGLLAGRPTGPTADVIHVRLGRALLKLKKPREAQPHLAAVPKGSAVEPEAAYHLADIQAGRLRSPKPFESVADRFIGTSWGEEALLDIAHHYAREGRHDQALPYERRLLKEYPEGRYAERAAWRVGWGELRQGRPVEAAEVLEAASRRWPRGSWTPGYLYWAGRARREAGQEEAARVLLTETVRRYKHIYHGIQARAALRLVLEGASSTHPAPPEGPDVPEPLRTRARQLLLIDRLDEAQEELQYVRENGRAQATLAWIHWRRGRLRPGINTMRRAYPEYLGEGGDRLPEPVWRILFPLAYQEHVAARAAEMGLDPALLAALINQESTFDPMAVSAVGARGLMQIMIPTGRGRARSRGIRFRPEILYDPLVNLDLGARYFRQVLNSFGGRVERALAAYNAGPTRVSAWTAANPRMSPEEFIESIPFPETRTYVMTILSSREHYRRIYGLGTSAP
jgi:soluble lytic murein transglycosylase